jgi:putative transposase
VKLESDPKEGPDDEAIEITEDQIIGVCASRRLGVSIAEVCRKRVSSATFYGWKAKFGGPDVSDTQLQRQLEDENSKVKRLLADAKLDAAALKDLLSKTW